MYRGCGHYSWGLHNVPTAHKNPEPGGGMPP